MTRTGIFAGLLAASLTTAALYAAPGMAGNDVTRADALAKADKIFARMDVNGDGTLSQADRAARLKAHFAEIDADKNGSISEAEFMAAREERMEKREDRRQARGDRPGRGKDGHDGSGMHMMKLADTNADQKVSKAEFRAAAEARFTRADTNNDGTLTRDERKAERQRTWGDRRGAPADAG
jgi:hypothetical protein